MFVEENYLNVKKAFSELKKSLENLEKATSEDDCYRISSVIGSIHVILDRYDQYFNFIDGYSDSGEKNLVSLDIFNVVCRNWSVLNKGNKSGRGRKKTFSFELKNAAKGSDYHDVAVIRNCLPIMSQVIFQIIDNAIKYAPDSDDVKIVWDDCPNGNRERAELSFSNLGPSVSREEYENGDIFKHNVRGANAEKISDKQGYGLGLYMADLIIGTHTWLDASIFAQSDDSSKFKINEVDYSKFSIYINFWKNNNEIDLSLIRDQLLKYRPEFIRLLFHEISGSMSVLYKLISDTSRINIWPNLDNSGTLSQDTFERAFDVYSCACKFIIVLYENGAESRPQKLGGESVFSCISKHLHCNSIEYTQQGIVNNSPYLLFDVDTLTYEYDVACFFLTKYLFSGGDDITIDTRNDSLVITSLHHFPSISDDIKSTIERLLEVSSLKFELAPDNVTISRLQ